MGIPPHACGTPKLTLAEPQNSHLRSKEPQPNPLAINTDTDILTKSKSKNMVKDTEEGCRTPKHSACRIPPPLVCPPPPKKKRPAVYATRKRLPPPPNGYFAPPDLELIFRAREALA
ncbi:hypothetical protein Fmac_031097 [Flemingia macrophylla]|uniref:Uncharacterized protein n=1 Tax=Flemingia macrophylla TaxID=520843 RepID=A0ABD1L144_9FABA